MSNLYQFIFGLSVALFLNACGKPDETAQNIDKSTSPVVVTERTSLNEEEKNFPQTIAEKKLSNSAFKTIEWTDLIPKEDLDALLNPPSYITDIEDGSVEDQISSQIQNAVAAANDDRYQQALVSTDVIPEMDGKAIRIPGFIVPLEFDDDQTITQFFLVPFFGACIHVPPPPPNQIIYINYPEGIKLNALYDPFWISGILKTLLIENELATAAYTINMQYFEIYTE